ncbi:HAD-IA family hydrolase [Jeongeupia naejangsanensis]|uniref:HAD-IA family hydrolase n=1 Tax=Jeongeupia naejangsanensis TaxID=613195 RepID=A0ABS2BLE2_9NEIS|nr:HAD-IA family hydrolase [Jeongeupia naejangsanensis]MBM3116432.1 HAD-IA family hydrolase [Jeongeupia naejangsanensis]
MTTFHTKALLLDMDGTLVDSTPGVEKGWIRWSIAHGIDPQTVLDICHGCTSEYVLAKVAPHLDPVTETATLDALEIEFAGEAKVRPGVAELLASLPASRWALVTSAGREVAETRFRLGSLPWPGVAVVAEDVSQGKPSPEPYLKAAGALGIAPQDCIVFEDAAAGVASGLAAGCRVVIVGDHVPMQPGVIGRIADFSGVTLQPDGDALVLSLG